MTDAQLRTFLETLGNDLGLELLTGRSWWTSRSASALVRSNAIRRRLEDGAGGCRAAARGADVAARVAGGLDGGSRG